MQKASFLLNMEAFCFIALIVTLSFYSNVAQSNPQTYIIQVKQPDDRIFAQSEDLDSWYHSFMPTTTMSSEEQPRMIYSYRNIMSGFAARLTREELRAVEQKNGFISARPEKVLHRLTTHPNSWDCSNKQDYGRNQI